MKAVIGLGNPGLQYVGSRHNVGFDVIDLLANGARVRVNRLKFEALTGVMRVGGEEVVLVKPQTYMNLSGRAVYRLVQGLRLAPADLLVIHDDLDLPLGRLRLRGQGSPGGHNGVKSIIACLGTEEFTRLRLGIGRPGPEEAVTDYVLEPFAAAEQPVIDRAVARAGEAVHCFLREGLAAAMGKFNRPDPPGAESE